MFVLVPCDVRGCTKRHGVIYVKRSALRPALDDSTAVLGTRARGDDASAARSAGTAPQPGDVPPPPG